MVYGKCVPLNLRLAAALQVKINLKFSLTEVSKHTYYRSKGTISFELYFISANSKAESFKFCQIHLSWDISY